LLSTPEFSGALARFSFIIVTVYACVFPKNSKSPGTFHCDFDKNEWLFDNTVSKVGRECNLVPKVKYRLGSVEMFRMLIPLFGR